MMANQTRNGGDRPGSSRTYSTGRGGGGRRSASQSDAGARSGTTRQNASRGGGGGGAARAAPPPREIVKTWAFDSVGPRKYALQIQRASNGNPCLRLVEGVPAEDGAYRKFNITVWSEDFTRLFSMLDEVRAFIERNNIRTPDGHRYEPRRRPQGMTR